MSACGLDGYFGIDEAGWSDDLFDDFAVAFFEFFVGGGSAYEDGLGNDIFEFIIFERAIVEGAGKSESVFDECLFACAIAEVHTADLGECYMGFIDEEEPVAGLAVWDVVEIVKEGPWT